MSSGSCCCLGCWSRSCCSATCSSGGASSRAAAELASPWYTAGMAKTTRKTLGRKAKPPPAKKAPSRLQLTEANRELILRLSDRTGLEAEVVIERALAGFAASAAPGMPLHVDPIAKGRKVVAGQKLFLSVDGKPEIEVDRTEFILGSAEGVDLRLDLPLISP